MVSRKPTPVPAAQQADLPLRASSNGGTSEELRDFIVEIAADLHELYKFYNVELSLTRAKRLGEYVIQRLNEVGLRFRSFDNLDQQGRVDYHLINKYLLRQRSELSTQWAQITEMKPLFGDWATGLVDLCERRQKVTPTDGKYAGQVLSDASTAIESLSAQIKDGSFTMEDNRSGAFRAAQQIEQLNECLAECYGFYKDYDPLYTWWTSKPYETISAQLKVFVSVIREHLVGIKPGDEDAIVGQPIGKAGIYAALDTEMIAYSPEELLQIAEKEYAWCEKEAIAASRELGYGDDWKKALNHAQNMYVEPGKQTEMVHELAEEAIEYVTKRDMVTLPEIAKECWRTYMMSPGHRK